jgi:uncharacterized membrane protein YkvI
MVQASRFSDLLTILKIAGAFIALLVGPGFATGQEVLQFFASEGLRGVGGAVLFLVVCSYVAVSLLLAGQAHGFRDLEEVFRYYTGPVVGTIYTWYTVVLIFSAYALMLAAAGSVVHDHYGLPVYVGSALMALAVLATLFFGLHEVIAVIGSIGPVLVVVVISISVTAILGSATGIEAGHAADDSVNTLRASEFWWLSGLLYAALQVTALFSFLPSLGATVGQKKELIVAGIAGPLVFFIALIAVILALVANLADVTGKQIPMLFLAESAHPLITPAFALVLLGGILTTCAPLLWVTLTRFAPGAARRYRMLAVALTLIGYLGSLALPFDRFLNLLYPTIGYSGTILIGFMLVKQIRNRSLA